MKVTEKADVAPIEPLLCSIEAGTAIIGRSKRFIIDAIARGAGGQVGPAHPARGAVAQGLRRGAAAGQGDQELAPARRLKNARRFTNGDIAEKNRRPGRAIGRATPARIFCDAETAHIICPTSEHN